MKRLAILFLAMTLILLVIQPALGEDPDDPTAIVSGFSVNPPVLDPGSYGTITISIRETGAVKIEDTEGDEYDPPVTTTDWTKGVDIYGVSLEGIDLKVISPAFEDIGRIGPDDTLTLTFTVHAPEKNGIYYPKVYVSTSGGLFTYPIPVNVNMPINIQKDAVIIVSSTYPDTVRAGEEIPVRVAVRNEGKTMADELTLRIENENPDISPRNTSRFYLGSLNPGEQKFLDITFMSDDDLAPGLIRIPVSLRYATIDGSMQDDFLSIDILLKGEAELGILSTTTTPRRVTSLQPFDIVMQIDNSGTGTAREVFVTIDLPMSGSQQYHVGMVDPDKDASAIFSIGGLPDGNYTYPVQISYTDDTGKHTERHQLSLFVTRDHPVWLGFPVLVILIILVIALVGVGFYYHFFYLPRKDGKGIVPWKEKK